MSAIVLTTDRLGRWTSVHWPWLLVGLAWAVAVATHTTDHASALSHHELLEERRLPLALAALIFLLAWQVMTIAMMLPGSLPLLRFFRQANVANNGGWPATAAFLAGYLAVWTAFALAALLGDALLHQLVHAWPWLAERTWLIAGLTLVGAGVFQFTPVKERCLAQCRSPFAFFVRHYRRGIDGAWRLGVHHGRFCLGCCWALMLVMVALGIGSLAWMVALSGVMLLERTALRGRHLTPAAGGVLIAWGLLVLLQPAWLPALFMGVGG